MRVKEGNGHCNMVLLYKSNNQVVDMLFYHHFLLACFSRGLTVTKIKLVLHETMAVLVIIWILEK